MIEIIAWYTLSYLTLMAIAILAVIIEMIVLMIDYPYSMWKERLKQYFIAIFIDPFTRMIKIYTPRGGAVGSSGVS